MTSTPPAPQRRRPKAPPRPVEVVAVEQIGPRLVSVTFGGEALRGFPQPAPTAHIKVQLPEVSGELLLPVVGEDGTADWPDGFPTMRTYTPLRYDEDAARLEVWFVDHGHGPASSWAATAKPGDRAAIRGPGGRFQLDPDIAHYWIGGDESALPAVVMLLEAVPATATLDVHLEVVDADDEIALPAHPGATIAWHHRTGAAGGELEAALEAAELPDGVHVWVAGEASSIRRMRRQLVDRGLDRTSFTTRGYWRIGEENHPDGDYGEE
jgi:NADPH-dependent ferric siderophore reductase